MDHRRGFLTRLAGLALLALRPGRAWLGRTRPALAAGPEREVLSPQTKLGDLIYQDAVDLDPSRLPITPLEGFRTAGPIQPRPDLGSWRLKVEGLVAKPLSLTYSDLSRLPALERAALLICPTAFAFHGLWRGPSLAHLLELARPSPRAGLVRVVGAKLDLDYQAEFSLAEAISGKLLLATGVNGRTLPQEYGFPLRLAALDHPGLEWVKYVHRIEVLKA